MNKNITEETTQIVKAINSLGNDTKSEFKDFVEAISSREQISLDQPFIDAIVEKHYEEVINVSEKIDNLHNSIDYTSGSEKMDNLEEIIQQLSSSLSDYVMDLQDFRIDLRLGMSYRVQTFISQIVNDFDELNQWPSSAG